MSFFKLFPTVFEPIAITMFLGIVGCFFLRDKKQPIVFFYYWAFLIIFMIVWRIIINAESSRYWAILIIPGILFCSTFCLACLGNKLLSIILILGIALITLGKSLHFNTNSKMIINAANVIATYKNQEQRLIIIEAGDSIAKRLQYYSGVPAVSQDADNESLQQTILAFRGLYDTCFLVFSSNINEKSQHEIILKDFQAELVFEQFHDNRQKKKLFVYKIIVPPKLEIKTNIQPFFINGDFETIVFKDTKKVDFPRAWNFVTIEDAQGECIPIHDEVISGETSLKITSSGLSLTLYPEPRIGVKEDGFIVFCVKKAKGALLTIREAVYDNNKEFISSQEKKLVSVFINTDDLHQFQIPVYKKNYHPDEVIRLYWSILAPNGLILDDVGFSPALSSQQNEE